MIRLAANVLALASLAAARETKILSKQVWYDEPFPQPDNTPYFPEFAGTPDLSLFPVHSQQVGYHLSSAPDAPSEFMKYVPEKNLLVVCNDGGSALDVYSLMKDGVFQLQNTIPLPGAPQSVYYKNGVVAMAIDTGGRGPAVDGEEGKHGLLAIFDADTLHEALAPDFTMDAGGYLPDHVSFTPDGSSLQVAIEAEPSGEGPWSDMEGGVSVFRAKGDRWKDPEAYTMTFVGFDAFEGMEEEAISKGMHLPLVLLKPGTTLQQNFEPEYIAYSSDSRWAFVILQENNAIAALDLLTLEFAELRPLGYKSLETFPQDLSGKDDTLGATIRYKNVWSMFQPDTAMGAQIGGVDYIVTANEGDEQDYAEDRDGTPYEGQGASETAKAKDLMNSVLASSFPDMSYFDDAKLGSLMVSTVQGVVSGIPGTDSAVYDKLVGFGGRSFSIWSAATGALVWDSGSSVERIAAETEYTRRHFNSDGGGADTADSRSRKKGPEPEGLTVVKIDGRTYLFGGAERSSMIYIWDISKPYSPVFLSVNVVHNCSNAVETRQAILNDPEAMQFVPADISPLGFDTLITVGAGSGTLHVFRVMKTKAQYMCDPRTCPEGCAMLEHTISKSRRGWSGRKLLFASFAEKKRKEYNDRMGDVCPKGCVPKDEMP